MEGYIQYINNKKLHYRELVLDGDMYTIEAPIPEDHLIVGLIVNGKRAVSLTFKPIEQFLCTGGLSNNGPIKRFFIT